MPDSPKVSLTVWRDAKTDPPEIERDVITDVGLAYSWGVMQYWEFTTPDIEGPCEPSVWCDPQPPGDDALAVEDLRDALIAGIKAAADDALICHLGDPNGDGEAFYARRAARLRRALEAIGTP